jgi:hypothetical protein
MINFVFGIFLIYQIIYNIRNYLKPTYVENYQAILPIQYPFMSQLFFTNTVVKNTYYRDAKFTIDIDGLSQESTSKIEY